MTNVPPQGLMHITEHGLPEKIYTMEEKNKAFHHEN